jgi:hypothetical protein
MAVLRGLLPCAGRWRLSSSSALVGLGLTTVLTREDMDMKLTDGAIPPRDSTCHYYSIGLPLGDGQDDVPALLRHVAKSIEGLAEHANASIAGLLYSNDEVNEYGEWPRMTVFYTLDQ